MPHVRHPRSRQQGDIAGDGPGSLSSEGKAATAQSPKAANKAHSRTALSLSSSSARQHRARSSPPGPAAGSAGPPGMSSQGEQPAPAPGGTPVKKAPAGTKLRATAPRVPDVIDLEQLPDTIPGQEGLRPGLPRGFPLRPPGMPPMMPPPGPGQQPAGPARPMPPPQQLLRGKASLGATPPHHTSAGIPRQAPKGPIAGRKRCVGGQGPPSSTARAATSALGAGGRR